VTYNPGEYYDQKQHEVRVLREIERKFFEAQALARTIGQPGSPYQRFLLDLTTVPPSLTHEIATAVNTGD